MVGGPNLAHCFLSRDLEDLNVGNGISGVKARDTTLHPDLPSRHTVRLLAFLLAPLLAPLLASLLRRSSALRPVL